VLRTHDFVRTSTAFARAEDKTCRGGSWRVFVLKNKVGLHVDRASIRFFTFWLLCPFLLSNMLGDAVDTGVIFSAEGLFPGVNECSV
jgi:hypothetical protein